MFCHFFSVDPPLLGFFAFFFTYAIVTGSLHHFLIFFFNLCHSHTNRFSSSLLPCLLFYLCHSHRFSSSLYILFAFLPLPQSQVLFITFCFLFLPVPQSQVSSHHFLFSVHFYLHHSHMFSSSLSILSAFYLCHSQRFLFITFCFLYFF